MDSEITGVVNRLATSQFFCQSSASTFRLDLSTNVDPGRALSSAVEHYLHTVGVAGSNPAARTIPCRSHATKKRRASCPSFPGNSSSYFDDLLSVSPSIEERGRFGQFLLQLLHAVGGVGSGFTGFVALLLGAGQECLERINGSAQFLL
jgi:hypothetical protein